MACKRCNDEGMTNHRHVAGGMCFACGRLPGGGMASEAVRLSARQSIISRIHTALRRAEQERAEGALRVWWSDISRDDDHGPGMVSFVMGAPEDVRARAVAAFARLGIAIA